MIELSGVEKKLGDFALKDISLQLPKGYIMGLIGANGAGKTTLLHIILGLYRADKGDVRIFGCKPDIDEVKVRGEIGWVLAEELFHSGFTLQENAQFYGKYYLNYSRALFEDYCERFGLKPDKKLKEHSKGEKLKFQFAFAMSHQPKLLLLDEPTASFDPEFRAEFLRIITRFVSDGEHSVILATHLTKDLDRIADYIAMLDAGRLIFHLERTQLEDRYRLVAGEEYKIKCLPADQVIAMESGEYGARAFVKYNQRFVYDSELAVSVPNLEDIMFYLLKKEKQPGRW